MFQALFSETVALICLCDRPLYTVRKLIKRSNRRQVYFAQRRKSSRLTHPTAIAVPLVCWYRNDVLRMPSMHWTVIKRRFIGRIHGGSDPTFSTCTSKTYMTLSGQVQYHHCNMNTDVELDEPTCCLIPCSSRWPGGVPDSPRIGSWYLF